MCELLTIAAAVAFTAIYFIGRRNGKTSRPAFTTMLMFWGAALMWSVDCVANKMDGEPLLDMSSEDLTLGVIILGAGLLVYAALSLAERLRTA
jgi:drug/metabolite transporter (DMT)-like permease